MSEVQIAIIQSLAKVIDAPQSGYAPRDRAARALHNPQTQTFSLSVVSVKTHQVLLQNPISGKQLLVDKAAFQSNSVTSQQSQNNTLAKGDRLLLISSNQQYVTFAIEKDSTHTQQKLTNNTLQNVANTLSMHWPDVHLNTIKKAQPVILNQLQIAANTQQANSLAKALLAMVSSNGKPSLTINAIADVLLVKPEAGALRSGEPLTETLRLNVHTGTRNTFVVNLPLPVKTLGQLSAVASRELTNRVTANHQVNVKFDVNSTNKLITSITAKGTGNQLVSQQSLNQINQVLKSSHLNIKQKLSPLLVKPHSSNLHNGIVVTANERNLQALGASIKQHLTQGLNTLTLQNADVLIAQNQQNPNKIQLSLLAKPHSVDIKTSILSALKVDANIHDSRTNKLITALPIQPPTITSKPLGSELAYNSSSPKTNIPGQSKIGKAEPTYPSQQLRTQLLALLTVKHNTNASITSKVNALKSTISNELNHVLPKAESITQTLPVLLKQLNTISQGAGHELQHLIGVVTQKINQNIANTSAEVAHKPGDLASFVDEISTSPSSQQIKEQLTNPVLPNVTGLPLQSANPISSQGGLVDGLVTMLKASLQAKLIAQQPQLLSPLIQSPQFAQLLPSLLGKNKATANPVKLLKDLAQLDPAGNLINELNKVLSNHSLHKLSSAESSLQTQDSFYYILPNMFSSQQKDIEIVIKREQQSANEQTQHTQHVWQLSMKLDVGKAGEVLAKVKLVNNTVDLNLYASTPTLKANIMKFLPYLNKRFSSLGLDVQPQCFVGKIPRTLHKTDFQVVQAYV